MGLIGLDWIGYMLSGLDWIGLDICVVKIFIFYVQELVIASNWTEGSD